MLVFQLGGFYIVSFYQLKNIRKEVKEKLKQNLSNEELTAITVRKGEAKKLTWTKDNEFLLNGKMYDVVRIEKTKSDITYFCLQDEKEEALFEHLDGLVLNELEHKSKEKRTQIAYSLFNLFCNQATSLLTESTSSPFTFGLFIPSFISPPYLTIDSPPPNYLC
ncbi:MAG: hypothetical protein RLZZ337_738 [Bacteroidota bacterium]|jgi:adenine-specific DNA glycosylase